MQIHSKAAYRCPQSESAFTIIEVCIVSLLIAVTMGSIMTLNIKSISTLRASREAAASSQILQQRIEAIRDRPWAEVSSSKALVALMSTPAESAAELTDTHMIETMKVIVPQDTPTGPVSGPQSFFVRRADGIAQEEQPGDFSTESMLFYEGTVIWHDHSGLHQRTLRTAVCSVGLTRSGVVGSVLGRPGTATGP